MQLEATDISFRHGNGPWLFRGMNLTLKPGEVVGLIGPSGCGKTTFSRILAGFEKPLEGKLTLDGQAFPKRCYHPVQMVFQHPEKAVNPRWKMAKVLKESGGYDQELLELLGIDKEWLNRWPNELSGGELQRFCVARALGPKTRFLIADEMTTMLDAITQAQIWRGILDISQKRGIGILVVSHEAKLVQKICHRVIDFSSSQTVSPQAVVQMA